jgi:hypothetical protein
MCCKVSPRPKCLQHPLGGHVWYVDMRVGPAVQQSTCSWHRAAGIDQLQSTYMHRAQGLAFVGRLF